MTTPEHNPHHPSRRARARARARSERNRDIRRIAILLLQVAVDAFTVVYKR